MLEALFTLLIDLLDVLGLSWAGSRSRRKRSSHTDA